jgi:hypothetical protein
MHTHCTLISIVLFSMKAPNYVHCAHTPWFSLLCFFGVHLTMCILCNFIDFFVGKLGIGVVHCQKVQYQCCMLTLWVWCWTCISTSLALEWVYWSTPQIQEINKGQPQIFCIFLCLGVWLQMLFRVLVCLVFLKVSRSKFLKVYQNLVTTSPFSVFFT